MLGNTLIFSGSPGEGMASVQTSIRLDPRHSAPAFRLQQLVVGHYFSEEYEASVEAAKQAIRSYPDCPVPHRWLAAAFGQLGRVEDARAALAKAIEAGPRARQEAVDWPILILNHIAAGCHHDRKADTA
jgi:tetratricopeptide (TPR) repeat protein